MTFSRIWRRAGNARLFDEEGFTLLELIISILILTLIIGAITFGLITVFNVAGSTTKSISDSSDAQAVSANLTNDVQSSAGITTSPTVKCGTGMQLLGLEWDRVGSSSTTTFTPEVSSTEVNFDTVVSYVAVKQGGSWTLERNICLSGLLSSPASTELVSADICQPNGSTPIPKGCSSTSYQTHPVIVDPSNSTETATAASKWISSTGVTKVTFKISEPGSHYTYSLVAKPVAGYRSSSSSGSVSPPAVSCGFAAPGTGPYSLTLCFVNFAPYVYTTANYTTSTACGQKITEGITGTPYELSFCLKVQAGSEASSKAPPTSGSWETVCDEGDIGPGVAAGVPTLPATETRPTKPALCTGDSSADIVTVPFPTYTDAPASEAYLGNNGFYTGVPGEPALYTYIEGSAATLYFRTIEVENENGTSATNWDLVTGDAESTDSTESITWSTCPTTGGGGLQKQCSGTRLPDLSLVADNPTITPPDYYGNACMNADYQQKWLTYGSLTRGVGTSINPPTGSGAVYPVPYQEVECAAGVSTDKTGTVMLEAPEPNDLTVNLVGTGLQAIFLGFRL